MLGRVALMLLLAGETAAVKVLQFQGDGKYSTDSFVHSPPLGTDLTDFTLCFWFRVDFWRVQPHMFQMATPNDTFILYGVLQEYTKGVKKVYMKTNSTNRIISNYSMDQWNHLCLISKMGTGETSVYINGHQNPGNNFERKIIPGEAIIVFGQEQDKYKGGYDETQAFSGWIADFGISAKVLTPEEIERIASCKERFTGDVLSTEDVENATAGWEVSSAVDVTEESDIGSFCEKDDSVTDRVAAAQGGMKFDEANETCTVMGGRLPTVSAASGVGKSAADLLWKFFKDEPAPLCLYNDTGRAAFWLADDWSPDKGAWIDPFSGEEHLTTDLKHLKYFDTTQDGESGCAILITYDMMSVPCDHIQPCTYCSLSQDTTFRLRGLNPEETAKYDTEYKVRGVRNGKFYLRGTKFSHICFKREGDYGMWYLESLTKNYGKVLKTNGHPFGENNWAGEDQKRLTLSVCGLDEFTCSDGRCIPLSEKCNSIPDCPDQSDELNCVFVQTDKTYIKDHVPRGREPGVKPMEVTISAIVLSIVNVDTVDLKFTLDFALTVQWYDERLQYQDLNKNNVLNSVSRSQLQVMWTPLIMMQNSLGADSLVFDDRSVTNIIREQENGTRAPMTSSSNALMFDGKENKIKVNKRYFQDFSCEMQLAAYPFDTQVCRAVFVSVSEDQYTGSTVLLSTVEEVDYHGPDMLLEYKIVNMTLKKTTMYDEHHYRASLTITLKRRVEYHLTNTFLQTFLLVAVGFATCFFRLENFTDKIMVTLTTMLVTATIMGTIQSGLPKTSYYKLIDIWLVFTLLIQVAIFGLHTLVGAVIDRSACSEVQDSSAKQAWSQGRPPSAGKRSRPGRMVNFFGKIIIMAVILTFNALFWYSARAEYNKA